MNVMTTPMGRSSGLRRLAFAACVMSSGPTLAGDGLSGTGDIKLGAIPRYAEEEAAKSACAPDSVVWADSATGFFYPKYHPAYGVSQHGAYTCYRQAEKADYWSLTPDSNSGHKGREFPLYFCTGCS